jgi:hypothetical protein
VPLTVLLFVGQLMAAGPTRGPQEMADAGPPRTFDWDVPKPVAAAQVGSGQLEAMGLPLDMNIARSKWKLNDLAIHYARRFIQAGFYIPPHQKPLPGSNLPRLSALDPVSMRSYLIVFYPESDGTTTMLLGVADLGHRRPMQVKDFGVPLFPGAKTPTTFELEGARAIVFSVDVKEEELAGFYRQTLTKAGWVERADEPGTYAKNGRAVHVLARPEGPRLGVVVLEDADRPVSGSSVAPGTR